MDFILFLFYGLFKIIKAVVRAIVNFIKYILTFFKVEFLSKEGKEMVDDIESLNETHWGSAIPIHNLPTLLKGLTTINVKPTSFQFYPDYTDAVFSLPFHKMPKTVHCSFAVKDHKMARWQLYFFQEATLLLERDKVFMVKHQPSQFAISVSKRFSGLNTFDIQRIPIKDRLKLAYANVLYDDGDCFQLQRDYSLNFSQNGAVIASLQYFAYKDIHSVWTTYYKAKYGYAPDNETAQKVLLGNVSYKCFLTSEDRSKLYNLLGLKNGVKNVEKLILKYTPKTKKKSLMSNVNDFFDIDSSPASNSHSGVKDKALMQIWSNAYDRLHPYVPEETNDDDLYSASTSSSTSSYSSSYSSSRSSGSKSGSSSKNTKVKKDEKKSFWSENAIRSAEQDVKNCQNMLVLKKRDRDNAKNNGSYQKSSKNYRIGNKVVNVYDYNVWHAGENLKRAKEQLAQKKKNK